MNWGVQPPNPPTIPTLQTNNNNEYESNLYIHHGEFGRFNSRFFFQNWFISS